MVISAHQPYFCPYPGYFAKVMLSDVFVLLDSVQFPRGGSWIARNRFKNDSGVFWIAVPVWKKGRGLQKINEVLVCNEGDWKRKHMESIRSSYARAPYLEDHLPPFQQAFSDSSGKITGIDRDMITHVAGYLDMPARVVLLSELGIHDSGTRLLVAICRDLGADRFLAFSSARKYLDEGLFHEAGITVSFINPPVLVYPQLWGDFIPNLSIYDLLFNCGKKAKDIMKKGYLKPGLPR